MYVSEALSVEWNELGLTRGTYLSRREKTGVRRAAVLWKETIAAVKAIQRRGQSPFVFTSVCGTRFNSNSFRDKFNRLRAALGVTCQFNQIRDGAYSASCAAGVDFSACQILAGHKLPGLSDHYIARTPSKVQPACDAVYREYAPFPASRNAIRIGRPTNK